MDLSAPNPMDRNGVVEVELNTLQDVLEEAYTQVGGTQDPVAHRRELTRLEAICAVLNSTSKMPDSRACKRVHCSLAIALRQLRTAARSGLVGIKIGPTEGKLAWLSRSDMAESILHSPGTHNWIGSISGWVHLGDFIRVHRKGLLREAEMATLFSCTAGGASHSGALYISSDLVDDPYVLPAHRHRPIAAANLRSFDRLLSDMDAAVLANHTEAEFYCWADAILNGADFVPWIQEQMSLDAVTAETALETASIALEVLKTRFEQGCLGIVLGRRPCDVQFVAAAEKDGIGGLPPGAVWLGHFDGWFQLGAFVLSQLRIGVDGKTIRRALLPVTGRKRQKRGKVRPSPRRCELDAVSVGMAGPAAFLPEVSHNGTSGNWKNPGKRGVTT